MSGTHGSVDLMAVVVTLSATTRDSPTITSNNHHTTNNPPPPKLRKWIDSNLTYPQKNKNIPHHHTKKHHHAYNPPTHTYKRFLRKRKRPPKNIISHFGGYHLPCIIIINPCILLKVDTNHCTPHHIVQCQQAKEP